MTRKLKLTFAMACTLLMAPLASAQQPMGIAQSQPGIAVAGSVDTAQLPKPAKDFIKKHFPGVEIKETDRNFLSGEYDVDLMDGTDLEFNSKGEIIEVEAGKRHVLSQRLLKELLPDKAYAELQRRGNLNNVETLKKDSRKGYKVELRNVDLDDYRFDINGVLISISD